MQNESLEALEAEIMEQSPPPDLPLENVTVLFTANKILGDVFEDINEEVGPIDLDDVADRADEIEAIR